MQAFAPFTQLGFLLDLGGSRLSLRIARVATMRTELAFAASARMSGSHLDIAERRS